MELKAVIKPFKNIWQVAGAMILMNLVFIHLFWPSSNNDLRSFLVSNLWGTCIWITQAVGNSAVFQLLDSKLPWKKGLLKRAIANIIGIGLYSTVAYLVVQFIMYALFFPNVPFVDVWINSIYSTKITLAISFSISFLLTFIGFGKSMISMEIEKEKLQTEMIRYKYDSLKNQINPHFLFNSFNVLSELVYEDQKLADKFIHQLSDLYRYVLDARDIELISLLEELQFIESFTFLLKTRFENRVTFEIEVNTLEKEAVIPMSIQLLIENCIKHNQATTNSPLVVSVFKRDNMVVVKNNFQPKSSIKESHQIGIKNLQEQFAFFTSEQLKIEKTDTYFEVSIPILNIDK
ncbi:MAG: two-component system LytT family sensor kinase [Salibacteraceae bacterium]|jgi:hypothetical protein